MTPQSIRAAFAANAQISRIAERSISGVFGPDEIEELTTQFRQALIYKFTASQAVDFTSRDVHKLTLKS